MQLIDRRRPPQEVCRVTVDEANVLGFRCGDVYFPGMRMCPPLARSCERCGLYLHEYPEIGDTVILYADGSAKLHRKEVSDVQESQRPGL